MREKSFYCDACFPRNDHMINICFVSQHFLEAGFNSHTAATDFTRKTTMVKA